jgi:P-type Cu2+ transporter
MSVITPHSFIRDKADSTEGGGSSPILNLAHRRCDHCGNRFQPRFETEKFCCSGCRVVHDLIQSGGFGSFYDLLGRRVLQPAANAEPAGDETDELAEAIAEAESHRPSPDAPAHLTLRLGNLSCTACVWLIDHLFRQHPGALKMSSDTARSTLTLWWNPGQFAVLEFVRDLHRYGYPASLCRADDDGAPRESNALLTRLGVTAGLAMNTMAFTLPSYLGLETGDELARLFMLVAFASSTLALAVGGSYFFQRALSSLKLRSLHMDVPISLGLIAAYLGSVGGLLFGVKGMLYFDFVAIFAFLMLSGRYLHLRLLDRNRRQLWARERDMTTAFRINAKGDRERIALSRIATGDLLEIPSGAMVPVESRLESGTARFQLDWINGEPEPVLFLAGQRVPAGAKNGTAHSLRLIAGHGYSGSFLEQLFTPVEEDPGSHTAAASTHPIRKYYLLTVILVALAGAGSWLAAGKGPAASLQVLISVLVVSCPCALGLALPLLDEILLSKLKSHGVFIRRHSLWNRLRKVTLLDFDKTGTLTEPVKRLTNPEVIEALEPAALDALHHLTISNHHPVGRALHDVLLTRFGVRNDFTELAGPDSLEELPGKGVRFHDPEHGVTWSLGRDDWACPDSAPASSQGCSLSRNGVRLATFHLEEAIRDGAIGQLKSLRDRGYRIRLLSGDPDQARVAATAEKLGLSPENVHANLSPEEKASFIAAEPPESTLFVGDGGNDSLAFQAAAATGSPATGIRAIESRADFVFTGRGFHAIQLLLDGAKRRRVHVAKIFTVALLYNLFAVGLCLAGIMSPLLAAIMMPLSSVVTTAMAARV